LQEEPGQRAQAGPDLDQFGQAARFLSWRKFWPSCFNGRSPRESNAARISVKVIGVFFGAR
jgi:hypothetical protein